MVGVRRSARTLQKRANSYDLQVGERLAALRKARGLSQGELGQKLGITFQQVQKYERGTNRISAGRLYEIAIILGVGIQYFFKEVSASRDRPDEQADELAAQFAALKDDKVRRRVLQLIGASASPARARG